MIYKITLVILLLCSVVKTDAQQNNKLVQIKEEEKTPLQVFNMKRSHLNEDLVVVFTIKKLNDDKSLNQLVEVFEKLDDKVVNLKCDLEGHTIWVGYTTNISVLDLMQVLNGQNFPASFKDSNGMTGMLNANGEIEYWYTKK